MINAAVEDKSCEQVWQNNLVALFVPQTAPLAERLEALPIPDWVQPAVGRDGSRTWQLHRPEGRTEWFGRTSMPTISAQGLLSQFDAGSGNVALAGIGSGCAAKLLLDRLGASRAVVVLETEPVNLALALRLWNLTGAIRDGRLVLLLAADAAGLADRLRALGEAEIGFDLPGRMLAWPWRPADQTQAFQILLEQTHTQLGRLREPRAREIIQRLEGCQDRSESPKALAATTIIPAACSGRFADWLAEGAEAMGLGAVSCWPENPLRAGRLAGVAAAAELAERHGSVELHPIDQCRSGWALADAKVRLVDWLVAVGDPGQFHQTLAGCDDWAVATTDRQRDGLIDLGWDQERVLRTPPAISPRAFYTDQADRPQDVVVISDLPAEDPEQAGVTLYSHKVLWDTLRDRLTRQPDKWRPDEASRWLERAEDRTGVKLSDSDVREQLVRHIQQCLGPAVVLSHAVKALLAADLAVAIYGRGWEHADWLGDAAKGPADDPNDRLRIMREAKVAVVGRCPPGSGWGALEAAAAGAAIVTRTIWPDAARAELFTSGREFAAWQNPQDLVARVKRLLGDEAARTALAQAAHQRAKDEHTTAVRLQDVLGKIYNA